MGEAKMTTENEFAAGYDKVGAMVAAFYNSMLDNGIPEPLAEKLTATMLGGLVEQIGKNARGPGLGTVLNIGAKGG